MVYAIAVSFVVSTFYLTFSLVSADSEVHKNPLRHIPPKRYAHINSQKLPFALKATSLTFTIIVLVIFTILGLTKNEYPDLLLFLSVLVGASIVFPIFIIGLAYIEWLSKRRVRNKVFRQRPFDELDKIGFTVSYINDKTKWYFTEETKEVSINNYLIQCDIRRESPNTIEFKAFVKHTEIEKERFKSLNEMFKQEEIYFDFGGLVKKYNIKKTMNLTIEEVKTDLTQFVQTLKREKFEPDGR